MTWTVETLVAVLDRRFPPESAEPWDRVGLVVGRPEQPVRRVLTVVDVVPETVTEALDHGADLVVAVHPLLLGGVSSVAATTYAGRIVHDLIADGVALFVAHTNADVAKPGVNDALAGALGLTELRPLRPIDDSGRGHGRVGRLPAPLTLGEFTQLVAESLPVASWGVRAAGDVTRQISTVAVCGGSGDSFVPDAVAAGVDAYVTGDLKHHVVKDLLAEGGPALLDAGHYSTERPWLDVLADLLRADTGLEIIVSERCTDPFQVHARPQSPGAWRTTTSSANEKES